MLYLLLSGIIVCALLICFIARRFLSDEALWWAYAIIFSVSLAIGIIFMWVAEVNSGVTKKQEHIIQNKQDLDTFFVVMKQKNPNLFVTEPHILPIGFVIFALDVEPESIFIYEYAWTRYNTIKDKGLEGNFVIMHKKKELQTVPNTLILEKDAFRKDVCDFQFELPAHFDLTKYPFDHQKIVILMQHPNFAESVILVPDFDSYDRVKSGYAQLSPMLLFTKWHVQNAYFFYTLTDYTTNFGIPAWSQKKDFPILSYTIEIQRDLFDPLVTTLSPLFIILFIVFALLLVFPKINIKNSANSILGLFASVFFAVVLSHQTFEQAVKTSQLVYFKCFYYIVYLVILLAAVNFLLVINFKHVALLHYRKNLIVRLLYWPLIALLFFVTTLVYFF